MLTVSLFLGLPIDASYEKALAEMDPAIRDLRVSGHHESYLNQTALDDVPYLGKFLGETAYVSDLELLEKNIYSVLHKMFPGHSHENKPLEVILVPSTTI